MQTTQFSTFNIDQFYFGVPVANVQEIVRYHTITRVPLSSSIIKGLINLRGQIVTAIDLRKRLGLSDRAIDLLPVNVVIRNGDNPVSLLVDEICDVITVSDEILEEPPNNLHGMARQLIQGVYKLKNNLLLVLDTPKSIMLDCNENTDSLSIN